jgi:hypothetical protein
MQHVADAVAALAEAELRAIIMVTNEVTQIPTALLSWIEHLADWELNRRAGSGFPLQSPNATIPLKEHVESLVAVTKFRDGFAECAGDQAAPVSALFNAIVGLITRTAEAISPKEHVESVVALTMLRDGFAEGGDQSTRALALFDAIVGVLTGTANRH